MKKITVAVCLDDLNGMTFNNRRQSRDKNLIKDFCENQEGTIFMTEYSSSLFEDFKEKIKISENPISECKDGDVCFIEKDELLPYVEYIETFIIYRWNKRYPRQTKFDIDLDKYGYKLISEYEFQGNAHDKITKGIYKK